MINHNNLNTNNASATFLAQQNDPIADLNAKAATDSTDIGALQKEEAAFQKSADDLQAKINQMPAGTAKNKTQADWNTLNSDIASMSSDIEEASGKLANLQFEIDNLSGPTDPNLAQAQADATTLTGNIGAIKATGGDVDTVNADIKTVTADSGSTPPPKSPIEHSVWPAEYDGQGDLDSDAYIQSLVDGGVNTINVFNGALDKDANGKPLIDGWWGIAGTPNAFKDEAQLKDFITKCKAAGITVKLTVGGAGAGTPWLEGWKNLTDDNIQTYAKALNDFCTETGADGIDFDEELSSKSDDHDPVAEAAAARAGKLAGALKDLNPNLQLSCCLGLWINDAGPGWLNNSIFLENAKCKDGSSAIDRVYMMDYEDGATPDQNKGFLELWKTWLKTNCNMDPSQISVGIEPNDSTISQTGTDAWIKFAKDEGFSTAIWDQHMENYSHGAPGGGDWGTYIKKIYDEEIPPTPSDKHEAQGKDMISQILKDLAAKYAALTPI